MSISTNFSFNLALSQMQDVQAKISKTQGQLATGELVANPSDSPDTTAATQRIQTALARQDSFSQSLTQVDNRLAAQETSISSSASLLTRTKELAIQASTDTVSSQDRKNIALEMRAMRDQLLSMANTQDENGNFIFGGARTGQAPFVADTDGKVRYLGDQGSALVSVGEQRKLSSSLTGSKVFVSVLREDNGQASGAGFFQSLDDLIKAVENGDSSGMQRGMSEVNVLQDGISHAVAEIGANRNVIEQQKQIVEATRLRLQSTLSGIKDTDYTEAATQLQREMLALQAGQSSFAQTAKLNLFEYIK
jgi:flagellar hook-associated protein 3 FlgL